MTSREALNIICSECQKYKGKMQVACPFRSISNDYCNEYEQIKKDLDDLEKYERALDAIARTINPSIIIINDQNYLTIHGDGGYLITSLQKEEGEILFELFGGTNYDTK